MNFLTADLEGVRCYLDDLVVWSSSWEDHLVRLRALFSTLAEANLTVNLKKSEFGHAHVVFLGHVVGQGQLAPVAAKIEAVQKYPAPSTRKSLMRFIGLADPFLCRHAMPSRGREERFPVPVIPEMATRPPVPFIRSGIAVNFSTLWQVLFGVIAAALAAPVPDEKVVAVHGAVAPAALTYGAHALTHAVAPGAVSYAAPALTHAVAPAAVSYAAPAVHHAVAPAAVSYAAPAVHHAVAPAAVSYAAPAVHHAVAPAVAYAAPTPVALPPAEVKVPVTRTHVEVPVHQKVHYGTQNYVAGATTTIHKPSLAAPAIAPPSTLLAKVTHNAPELTIQRQEVPVEKHTPNFVDTPYHAGTIVKYTEPEVREVKPSMLPQPPWSRLTTKP
ncbi:hypothetical protein C7M84_005780 [Penaeus vannamei]|uniref:Reverse transcriptase domain-containing protein n=1 Tax=Penaeus vannamei TaxID=6689 RepID=A0A3R7PLF1_PENVA|nr:hypothetical protein C7M84_005780 [Penaeus vannamei]